MNPINNPYAAGAGLPPAVLTGREALRERVRIAIARLRVGRPAKSVLMVGLRGVGKTVLLEHMRLEAEGEGVYTLHLAAPETRSLPAVLAAPLSLALQRLSRIEAATDPAQRALRALAGFAQALKGRFTDIEFDLAGETQADLAHNGDLEADLTTVLEHAGGAARAAGTALVLFIDELQCVEEAQLGALIAALHRCTQARLPVMLVGAGLPALRGRAGKAKSYAERLFDYPEIGPLSAVEAALAIVQPAEAEGIAFEVEAVAFIVARTRGYPYFLQALASHAWDVAATSPITLADVEKAATETIVAVDEGFFRGRFDRLTPMEKQYLRAMADLGPGPHRSGAIAERQGRRVQAVAPVRNSLIGKGLIWSPGHGDTAFTAPFFDEFMKRIMP
jgi:hypothetical protein